MFLTRVKASADDRSAWSDFWFQPVGMHTASGTHVTPDRALTLSVVYACVRVLAESFSVLPPKVYQVGDTRKLLRKHWLYDLFMRHPNQYQTPFEWREMLMGHLVLRGNCYNRIVTDRRGNITALIPMHPDRIKIEFINTASEFDYRYRYTDRFSNVQVLSRADVWHIRGLSGDGILGLNPIALARESIGLGLAAQEYGGRFFANDAKPGGGWIEFPGNFKDKAAREAFRESWQEAHGGANRGHTAVLEHGMKFHELGLTNKDSQFLEARQFQVVDIARMHRVPPHMVGDLSKSAFSNIEQQSLDFVTNTMTAWAERWESSIESDLLLEDEADIEVDFDFARLLRGDRSSRATFNHLAITDGYLTRNEAREAEGKEPLDGLDTPLLPLNMKEEGPPDDEADPDADQATDTEAGPDPDEDTDPDEEPVNTPPDSAKRMRALIRGNAARIARRMARGNAPSAKVLADALAVAEPTAAAWLAKTHTKTEPELIAELMTLEDMR